MLVENPSQRPAGVPSIIFPLCKMKYRLFVVLGLIVNAGLVPDVRLVGTRILKVRVAAEITP